APFNTAALRVDRASIRILLSLQSRVRTTATDHDDLTRRRRGAEKTTKEAAAQLLRRAARCAAGGRTIRGNKQRSSLCVACFRGSCGLPHGRRSRPPGGADFCSPLPLRAPFLREPLREHVFSAVAATSPIHYAA